MGLLSNKSINKVASTFSWRQFQVANTAAGMQEGIVTILGKLNMLTKDTKMDPVTKRTLMDNLHTQLARLRTGK